MVENHHPGPRRALAGLTVLFLLTVAFFWKLVLTNQYSWMESPDLAHQVLPWLQYQAGEFHEGRLPLWAPYEWSGQPLLGQGQSSTAYPFNWILYSLPLKRGWIRTGALNWYYVIIHWMAAWFMYLLCRDLKRSFAASIVAGIVFGLGGYCGTIDWPQMLNGAIWAPLIWMFHLRAVRGELPLRNALLGGFCLGLSWLSGHHQVPIFLTLASGISWIYFIWRDMSNIRWAMAFGSIFVLIGGMQLLPAWEYGHLARRWVGLDEPIGWKQPVPFFLHQQNGFFPLSILGIALPGFNLNTSAYIGIAAVTLAIAGIALGEIYFAVLACAALLYSLSQFGALEGLFYSLFPMVDKARSPAMAVIVFGLAAGPLAARGLDGILSLDTARIRRVLYWFGAGLLAFYFIWSAVRGLGSIPEQRPVMTAVAAIALAAALGGRPANWRWIAGGLVFLELTLSSPYYTPNRFDKAPTPYLKYMSENQDLVDYLRSQPQPVRILVDSNLIKFNFGDWHGVDVFGGYLASLTENLFTIDFGSVQAQRLLGVTHTIGYQPVEKGQTLAHRGVTGINVWAMPDPLPRAWVVHSVLRAQALQDQRKLLTDPLFDFRKAAFANRELNLETCAGDHATLLRRDPSHVVVGVEANCRGMLVVSEIDYPGWRVEIDGRAAEKVTVNGALRGVVVEQGWHRVDFRFRPSSAIAGAAMTISGMAIVLAALIMGRRRT